MSRLNTTIFEQKCAVSASKVHNRSECNTARNIREFSGAFGEPRGLSAELDFPAVPGTA